MKVSPALFTTPMVRALLDGAKAQTRRLVQRPETPGDWSVCECAPQPFLTVKSYEWRYTASDKLPAVKIASPYGGPGDLIYVRETWRSDGPYIHFRADTENPEPKWRSCMHMPRSASRMTLRIESATIERLQAMTQQDAIYEGIEFEHEDPRIGFAKLWNQLYKIPGQRWGDSPWVWLYKFKVIYQNVDVIDGRMFNAN